MKTKKLVTYALLVSVAMILSYVEHLLPVFVFIPGVKMGLANIATVFAIYTLGFGAGASVSLIRVCLSVLLFGNAVSFMYSIVGAALSLLVMLVAKCVFNLSKVGVSVLGGVFHNVGQISVAAFMFESGSVFLYIPVLLISGTLAGIVIGVASAMLVKRTEKYIKM